MKITTLDLWAVELTSHQPYHMASGKTCATVTTHVLRVRTQYGLEGWGRGLPYSSLFTCIRRRCGQRADGIFAAADRA